MTDNSIEPATRDALMLRAMALKVVSAFTGQQYDEARAEVAEALGAGDRVMVRSPLDGTKLGPVTASDPKPVASVVDDPALLAWTETTYPEHVESGYRIVGTDTEVKAVLFEHAPHLLGEYRRVKPDFVKQLRADSATFGQPIGPGGELDVPGVEVRTPSSVISCRPTEEALLAVMDMHRSGRLLLDGTTVPELEA